MLGVRSEQKLLKLKHHENVKQVLYRANYLIVKRLRYPGFPWQQPWSESDAEFKNKHARKLEAIYKYLLRQHNTKKTLWKTT